MNSKNKERKNCTMIRDVLAQKKKKVVMQICKIKYDLITLKEK